jgi:hypothetical protein
MTQRITVFTFPIHILFIPKSEGKAYSTIRLTLLGNGFKKVSLVHSRVGAKARAAGAGALLRFLLRAGAAEK